MSIHFDCPNPACGASATVAEDRLGRDARCTRCGWKFALIPGTRAPAPSFGSKIDFGFNDEPAPLPARFDRFQILRELGRGGMGTVYLAEDTDLGRLVALKVAHPAYRETPEIRERLLREARAAARFRHPNFCPIHDIGEVDGVPYLRMSYIEGQTLAALIGLDRPWPQRRASETVRTLALALAEAHRQGIIHRDLKPANVMVEHDGTLVIMDFGLALQVDTDDPRLTATGMIVGTPAYMPPEQIEGNRQVGPRSDIYSLGVILFELLTARRPFEGSAARVMGLVIVAPTPSPSTLRPGLDRRLESICLKAMAKRPEDRHASMDEFAEALRTWRITRRRDVSDQAIPGLDHPRIRLASPRPNGSPTTLAIASVLTLTVATTAWLATRFHPHPGHPIEAARARAPDPGPPASRASPPEFFPSIEPPSPASTPSPTDPTSPITHPSTTRSVAVPEPGKALDETPPRKPLSRPSNKPSRKPRRRTPAVFPEAYPFPPPPFRGSRF